jgi:hypothetical protein
MITHALDYARHGLRVFPVASVREDGSCTCHQSGCSNAGKHPLNGAGGFRKATTDVEMVTLWWTRHPDANIGYATGVPYLVIDIDGEQGEESWQRLHAEPVDTLAVKTGGGGRHLYFRLPAAIPDLTGSVNARLAPGIDVRAGNGYVLLPPSRHKSGRAYAWLEAIPALPLPAWLLGLVKKERHVTAHDVPRPSFQTSRYGDVVLAACTERLTRAVNGERNTTLAREAFILGQYVAGGEIDSAGVEDYLVEVCPDPDKAKTRRTVQGQLREGANYPKSRGARG